MGSTHGHRIPSRVMHSDPICNPHPFHIPVGTQETRVSFTQYCAGEIFHWVDNGFCTEKELKQEDPVEWGRLELLKEERLEWALAKFSTLDELGLLV